MHLSLPGYTNKELKQFNHKNKNKTSHTQAHLSYMVPKNNMQSNHPQCQCLTKGKEIYSKGLRKFLFLDRAVNSTLLCPSSAIASQSANPTKETMRQTHQLFDYIATQENEVITYTNSDLKLAFHSNASYLCQRGESKQAVTTFYPKKQRYHKTMAQFSTLPT